jgi:hypothetical protein
MSALEALVLAAKGLNAFSVLLCTLLYVPENMENSRYTPRSQRPSIIHVEI